jgi:hypothetical protein
VHIAARVLARAGAGELLCSRTVKDLVAGAGFVFIDVADTGSRACRTLAAVCGPARRALAEYRRSVTGSNISPVTISL